MMDSKKDTQAAEIGKFKLIEQLSEGFPRDPSATTGPGDDAAVIWTGERYTLLASVLMLEGVHFDLTYFPLKHLGYKAVTAAASRIYTMNGLPGQLSVSLGVSARMNVGMLEEFYAGMRQACQDYAIVLAGNDLATSLTGFTVAVTVVGEAAQNRIVRRSGASTNDLLCITGDLGAAFMGLKLLERERRVLEGHDHPQPKFEGYEYLLRRQLMPAARRDVIDALAAEGLVPTSMTLVADGLASDLLHVCKASGCGARIYLDRLPIASETYKLADEMHLDPVMAALNGGDDYELLFTVPVAMQEKIAAIGGIDIIGHVTAPGTGVELVTPDGAQIALTAPGWTAVV